MGKLHQSKARKITLLLLIFGILLTFMIGPMAWAQSDCAGYDCFDKSDFDTADFDGWIGAHASVGGAQDATLEWLDTKAIGLWPFQSWANGVLKVTPHAWGMIQKQTYLSPGIYRLVIDGGLDLLNTEALRVSASTGMVQSEMGTFDMGSQFSMFISEPLTITEPSPVSFSLSSNHASPAATWYFDYIWIVQDISATPTPGAGTPTATPLAVQATPLPTSTPYCYARVPTATPAPQQFSLTPSPTPGGPTATPTVAEATDWSLLDKFETGALHLNGLWRVTGTGIEIALSVDHSGSDLGGSVFIPNSTITDTTMLVFNKPDGDFTLPFYLNAWGQAKTVEEGATQYVDIWVLDPAFDDGFSVGGRWEMAVQVELSAGRWYAFHNELNASEGTGHSGRVSAMAFSAERADASTSGGIYLDDVFAYGDLNNAPYCDGTYPLTRIQYYVGSDGIPSTTGPIGPGEIPLTWPANKPCPPDILVPNNFWGPLIAEITVFLDQEFAFTPAHQPGNLVSMTQTFIASPVSIYLGIVATFFNLRIPLLAMLIVIALDIGSFIRGVWMIIKDSIPFL